MSQLIENKTHHFVAVVLIQWVLVYDCVYILAEDSRTPPVPVLRDLFYMLRATLSVVLTADLVYYRTVHP